MSVEFQWENHNIEINSKPLLKYLWLATETTVKVDDMEIGRAGGFRLKEQIRGQFNHNNRPVELILDIKADLITLISVPYKLQVDGNILSQGRLKVNDWQLFLVPMAIFISCACCSAALISYGIIAQFPVH